MFDTTSHSSVFFQSFCTNFVSQQFSLLISHLGIFIGLQQLGGLPEQIGNLALCFQVELIQAARGRALAKKRREPGELRSQLLDAPVQRDP